MDFEQAQTAAKALETELSGVLRRHNVLCYGFTGFIGEPGKGCFPTLMHVTLKDSFKDHSYVLLSKAAFLASVDVLKMPGGSIAKIEVTS